METASTSPAPEQVSAAAAVGQVRQREAPAHTVPAETADPDQREFVLPVVEPPIKWRLYQPCLYLRCCAGEICAVGWMDLMIILQLLLCLTRCEPR
jgi:hypothetical protein